MMAVVIAHSVVSITEIACYRTRGDHDGVPRPRSESSARTCVCVIGGGGVIMSIESTYYRWDSAPYHVVKCVDPERAQSRAGQIVFIVEG